MLPTAPETNTFDYVIVGGGIAGLVVATRLSEDATVSVLVIEAGPDQSGDPRVDTPGFWPTLLASPVAWGFKTVPQAGLGGRELSISQGRMLGGSGALNGLAFSPPSKADVDAWAELGNPGWEWSSFAKSLKKAYKLTTLLPGGSQRAESDGPLQLTLPSDEESEWPRLWREAIGSLGFPVDSDPLGGSPSGAVSIPDTVHPVSKKRSHAVSAYLQPALEQQRANLSVWTKTTVERIIFERPETGDPVALGVQYVDGDGGESKTVTARKEVILAAGALNTPRLLELSGVGDAGLLRSLGIDPVVDNPHVGENLQNHPMCAGAALEVDPGRTAAEPGLATLDQLARQDPAALGAAMAAYGDPKGPGGPFAKSSTHAVAHLPLPGAGPEAGARDLARLLATTPTTVGTDLKPVAGKTATTTLGFAERHEAFVRSSVLASSTEASAVYISFPGYAAFGPDGGMVPPPAEGSFFSVALVLAHPLSRGSVHIRSSSPSGDLAIDPNYFSHPLDIEVLARHMRFLAKDIAGAAPLARVLLKQGTEPAAEGGADGSRDDDDDLERTKELLRRTAVGANHYVGTCSMMPRGMGGVVDPQLRVYGCKGLRVVDASVLPLTPRANPQAAVYGLAEHAAQIIKSGGGAD